MMVELFFFFIFWCIFSGGIYVFAAYSAGATSRISLDTLLKTEKFRSVNYFYACVNMTVISLQVIFMVIRIRRHISMLFYKHALASEEKGVNWLKLRTIEIECNSR